MIIKVTIALKLCLKKSNKAHAEEYFLTDIPGFLDAYINKIRDTTPQDDLCSIIGNI